MNDAERFQAPIHSYPVSRDKPALFTKPGKRASGRDFLVIGRPEHFNTITKAGVSRSSHGKTNRGGQKRLGVVPGPHGGPAHKRRLGRKLDDDEWSLPTSTYRLKLSSTSLGGGAPTATSRLLPAPSHATPRAPPSLPPLSFVSPLGSTNASTSPATAHDTTRNVTYAGTVANDVEQFPSIPYGQPTSGTRRFANPVPASLADGSVVDATSDGDACPQPDAEASGFGANVRRSEDCLRLNVARPVGTKEGDELPVVLPSYVFANFTPFTSKSCTIDPSADDYALLRAVSRCWSTFAWYVTPSVEGKDTLAGWTPACARGGNETDLFVIGAPEEGLSAVEGKNAKTVVAEQRLCERCGFLNSEEVVRELLY
ncbi:hypothetical protein IWX47DRAFT_845144 [Phyllosticta citricarpa]